MLRAAILALPLLVPFAAVADDASQAFPADQYTAKVVMRRGDFPITTASVAPDVSGRFTVAESSKRSFASKVNLRGDAVLGTEMAEIKTGSAVSFSVVRDGEDLLLLVDAASRTLDSVASYRIGEARIELPSVSACHRLKVVKARREGDHWGATLAMPECGIDTEITISASRI